MVLEIPRKKIGEDVISATRVRELLKEKEWEQLKKFVPETTISILRSLGY